ncbi:MAG: deoxyribose-phosphate aldolase [Bacteroidetes bacterium]|nr:deoxyribose-phosphate aldolase [Bacteroidota bacterium]
MNLASKIDHTLLRADTSREEVIKLCDEAKQYGFAAVCIPPYWVRECKNQLRDSRVHIATVVGFPMGYAATPAKVEEARRAIDEGASEIDMVLNIIALKSGDYNYLKNELTSAGTIVQLRGGKLKIILETGLLTKDEIIKACELCAQLNVDYVKTSTGMIEKGATVEDIKLLRAHLPKHIKIKASGGIRDKATAIAMIEAGADRIGTSQGVKLVTE